MFKQTQQFYTKHTPVQACGMAAYWSVESIEAGSNNDRLPSIRDLS